ncbi:MAG: site-specific integrase [Oligoflexia bacterium]|nr:site-specific integrase [Oligoflexia bacterium]
MSIKKITENGKDFFKVYVHVRSKVNRKKRIQKYSKKLSTMAQAIKEEKRLFRQATIELQKLEGIGLNWGELVDRWWQDVKAGYILKVNQRSAEGYLSTLNKWTKHWNDRPASEITIADARELLIQFDKANLSKAYQKKVKNIINKVYYWGIEFRYIVGNDRPPFKGLQIEVKEHKAPDILSLEEIKKFLMIAKTMNHLWYPTWSFAILTGMRSGELHALTWDQIDLEKEIILVDRSYDSNMKKVGPTKGRYWRTIPINSSLKKLILELKNGPSSSPNPHVLPRSKDWDNGDQAVPLRNFLNSINMKPIKFHALRACFATQMLANGVPSPIVMKIGGWKKSATMDIYLRLAGVDTKGATDCLQFIPEEISFGDNIESLFNK